MRASRPARTAFWMAAYVACFVVVLAFIFFEVLDVDGSDFDRLARTATIQAADAPNDVRRPPLHASAAGPTALQVARERIELLHAHRVLAGVRFAPLPTELRRASRMTFARARLADPAPSA